MDGRFTDEELAIAKRVDLCAVAESLGYTVKRIGKYHTLKEMDSIRIYNRSHWYRWSRQFDKGNNGGSQIDFLRVFCGMSVKEAVFWLLDFAGYRRIENPVKQPLVHQVSQKQAEERKPFVLPEPAGDAELSRRFSMQDEAEQKAKIDREQANELEYVDESQKSDAAESASATNGNTGTKPARNPEREKPKWEDTITNRMLHWSYTPEQKEEVKKALAAGVPKATILTYFYPEVTVERMSSYRKKQ